LVQYSWEEAGTEAENNMKDMLTYMEPLQQEQQEQELEDEVQVVAAPGEGTASPNTIATTRHQQKASIEDPEAPPTGAVEEQSVNPLESGGEKEEEEGEEHNHTRRG
jgi:hypothetical protein